jgi:aminoglycoside phosphotransferase family enzyme/predicted kinase
VIPQSATRLIRALEDPTVFGAEAAHVQTLQTHMSWVLLVGPYAYKIKKPLDLGFADFSTLARRRHFCEEELRINRRLAREMYLDVVPICGTPDAPVLRGSGPPIEYAVQMRQFPQQDRLDRVLERNELDSRHIDALVDQIAAFHQRIRTGSSDHGFGSPEAIGRPMSANFQDLADRAGNLPEHVREQLERLRQWSEQEFDTRRYDFVARKRHGFVRECHGDMHLRNIALLNSAIVIFDAIEFNENLRWIDVLSELAFLIMDLEDRGRADFARRALNRYLEIGGDYEGLVVLPYYLVYRALVRAKVARIRQMQNNLDCDQRERLGQQLRGYLDLAEAYRSPSPPMMILTHGYAASGKTTGTQRLLETLGAIRIRSDVERKRLYGLTPLTRTGAELDQGLYTPDATRQVYQRLAQLAGSVLQAGATVIVDAAFLRRDQRLLLFETAERLQVPLVILDFQADQAILRRRITQRARSGTDASEANLAVLENQVHQSEPLTDRETGRSIRVDTSDADWLDRLEKAATHWRKNRVFGT